MSRFQSEKLSYLTPYTPGEQPRDMQYVKLNTNESPFPPSKKAIEAATEAAARLQLYNDPTCRALTDKLAETYGVSPDEVIVTNGSDEVLDFAFQAFCDDYTPAVFADITYGFYPVFAQRNGIGYCTVALKDDFTIDIEDYFDFVDSRYFEGPKIPSSCMIVIANPNAPTGIALSRDEIEQIVKHNQMRRVLRVIEAAFESDKLGKTVDFEEV